MKVQELLEAQRIIKGDVDISSVASRLDYLGALVKGDFDCRLTYITSLEGSPSHVGGDFNCSSTKIKSLEGAPSYIGGNFNCWNTDITSLKNIHKHIKHIGGVLFLPKKVRSRVLGVVLIKGLRKIDFHTIAQTGVSTKQKQVETIINKHLLGDRDPHACQEEMLEAGLGEYAKL